MCFGHMLILQHGPSNCSFECNTRGEGGVETRYRCMRVQAQACYNRLACISRQFESILRASNIQACLTIQSCRVPHALYAGNCQDFVVSMALRICALTGGPLYNMCIAHMCKLQMIYPIDNRDIHRHYRSSLSMRLSTAIASCYACMTCMMMHLNGSKLLSQILKTSDLRD